MGRKLDLFEIEKMVSARAAEFQKARRAVTVIRESLENAKVRIFTGAPEENAYDAVETLKADYANAFENAVNVMNENENFFVEVEAKLKGSKDDETRVVYFAVEEELKRIAEFKAENGIEKGAEPNS